MSRPISKKCLECSKVSFPNVVESDINYRKKPDCWSGNTCKKKRSYYRKIEEYREKQRLYHRYLRNKEDNCRLCMSNDNLQVHHIISQADGGTDCQSNLMTLCFKCHNVITTYNRIVKIKNNS